MTKTLLLIGTLALAGIASAKSYEIAVSAPANAAGWQMDAGRYEVKVVGANFAVFTNVETGKKYLAPVKVQEGGKRFEQTAVDSNVQNGAKQIKDIELGGSNTTIELGE